MQNKQTKNVLLILGNIAGQTKDTLQNIWNVAVLGTTTGDPKYCIKNFVQGVRDRGNNPTTALAVPEAKNQEPKKKAT